MTAILSILLGSGIAVTMALLALYQGWALSLLWNWFIAPLGIAKISVIHGYGITLVGGLLKGYSRKCGGERSKEDALNDLVAALSAPIIIVGCAYVAKLFL